MSIPVPYGYLAAKWWGRQDVRPIVCLHGWQDNCGTFDTLIPLLPKHVGYLAIDLPGHGLSSFLPDAIVYSYAQYITVLDFVFREHFKWPKVSIIAHSMSGIFAFVFAAIFPDYVDMTVSFDILKPPVMSERRVRTLLSSLDGNILKTDLNNIAGVEPPTNNYEELIDKMVLSTGGSVNRESALYLLQRGSKPSKYDPNRYYFSRDNRTKNLNQILLTREMNLTLAKQIRCPYLFFRGENSPYSENPKELIPVMQVLQQSNPLFEVIGVESSHHMHLVNPEKIEKHIVRFINRYRPSEMSVIAKSKL